MAKIVINTASLKVEASTVAKNAKQIGAAIHTLAMKMARHAELTKDVSAMTYFVTLLDNKARDGGNASIVRSNAVKQWFISFGFARWAKDKTTGKEGFKFNQKALDAKAEDHYKQANAMPWNRLSKEAEFKPVDSFEMIGRLLKSLEDKATFVDEKTGKKHSIDPKHIAAVKSLYEGLKAERKPVETVTGIAKATRKVTTKSPAGLVIETTEAA